MLAELPSPYGLVPVEVESGRGDCIGDWSPWAAARASKPMELFASAGSKPLRFGISDRVFLF